MIVKDPHYEKFTVVSNHFLCDVNLSFGAKGLLAHILMYPEKWQINKVSLEKTSRDGKTRITSLMEELIQSGYVQVENRLQENGVPMRDYIVYETPPSLNTQRTTDFAEDVKPDPIKKDNITNWDSILIELGLSPEIAKKIQLAEQDVSILIQRAFNPQKVRRAISRINEGKVYSPSLYLSKVLKEEQVLDKTGGQQAGNFSELLERFNYGG